MSLRDMAERSTPSPRRAPAGGGRRDRVATTPPARSGRHAVLTEVARAIVGRSRQAEAAQVVVAAVRRLVPADRSLVWSWLPDRDAVQLLAVDAGPAGPGLSIGQLVPLGESRFRRVLETGRSLREADLGRRRTWLERALAADGLRSRLSVPVLVDGGAIGVLAASSRQRGVYTAAHARLLEQLAGYLAIGLEQARLSAEARRQRRVAEEVARAAAVIVSEMDQQRRLDLIVERAVEIVGGAAGSLDLLDRSTGNLVVRACHGYPDALSGQIAPPGRGVGQRVIAERRAVLVDEHAPDADPPDDADPWAYGSTIGVPVMARGELLGALVIQAGAGGPRLTAEDVPLIQAVAGLAAVALDNARSLEREQQRRRQIEAVRSVTAELTRELDLPSLLDLILMRASQFVRCESVAVLLWDQAGETLVPKAWRGRGDWDATTRLGLGDDAAGAAARHREGVVFEDYRHATPGIRPGPDDAGPTSPTSVMAVPMIYQDRLTGVLTANRFGVGETFNRHDLELLELLGTQAAVAIENARLFEQATTAEALRELAQLEAELLNTVSHELRTPLSLIHGYAELLVHRAERLEPAEVAQMSGEIYAGSRTLARLVDDLLDFARLEHGRLELRRQRVALGELIESLTSTFRSHPGGERIATELEPGLAVDADPERLHQVIANLLANALAYTSDGPIVVHARHENGDVRVEVADHGPGLAANEVDRVWESFYRGAEAAQLPHRGSGLGLTVVRQLVELHGGRVGVRSIPGQGATFWFSLPAA
jgi:signal transduction histidine kinase